MTSTVSHKTLFGLSAALLVVGGLVAANEWSGINFSDILNNNRYVFGAAGCLAVGLGCAGAGIAVYMQSRKSFRGFDSEAAAEHTLGGREQFSVPPPDKK